MAASAEALLLFVAVASDAAASSGARGLRQKAAIGAAENDGGYNASAVNQELMRLTRIELIDLLVRITNCTGRTSAQVGIDPTAGRSDGG